MSLVLISFLSEEKQGRIRPQHTSYWVLVNAVTGSVGNLLVMCGHEYLVRNINISAVVVTIIACYIMTPVLQGVGAAIAIATGMVFKNIVDGNHG
jgi:hypothetical protein